MPKPKQKTATDPSHEASDVKPIKQHSPAQDMPPLSGDAPPKPKHNAKLEEDVPVINPSGHLQIIGKHVPSGDEETRLFQIDINTKQYLTREEAKAQGRYWRDH